MPLRNRVAIWPCAKPNNSNLAFLEVFGLENFGLAFWQFFGLSFSTFDLKD